MTHKNHYRPIPSHGKSAKHTPDINLMLSFHVETVVLLSHKKADAHINVNVEFGEGDGKIPVDKIAEKAEEYRPS